MSAPNVNTLWGGIIADELAKAGVEAVCLAPGSRSTALTVAIAEHEELTAYSHLDERSAAFFALGRAKRTGIPTALVCTSGTALANFHPAVIEASQGRVPLLLLTADRPPELRDSGANQTIDQEKLFGDAVRAYRTLPEPEAADRKLRSLRTAVCRAVADTGGNEPGPVHLNVPFRKPLEPTVETDEVPEGFIEEYPLAAQGRDGPFVSVAQGRVEATDTELDALAEEIQETERGLIVCGPADAPTPSRGALAALARATGYPVLADPLSGHRFGGDVDTLGGYDAWYPHFEGDPEFVLRFGASPTSKPLRKALAGSGARQVLVDPAGKWREAEFTATDLLVADADSVAEGLAARVERGPGEWAARHANAEAAYWDAVPDDELWEGRILGDVARFAPDPATIFVSNSMPVRDLDRFAAPSERDLTVLANRGASGIDGIASTALGGGSATDDPLILVTGDVAFYHDMNGLLAIERCGVDATIVVVNNDGGGIFHVLPIEEHATFEEFFKTPHGMDFEPVGDLYGLEFTRTDSLSGFRELYRASLDSEGTQVIDVQVDGQASHDFRRELQSRVESAMRR